MENGDGTPTLYTTDDTGNYVEYTPPEPPGFHETLPEDLRESEHLKEVKGADDLARYYVDLKSNYLKPPDTVDGYEFEKPDGFELDEDTYKQFKEIALENGVNQKQFAELMNLEVQRDAKAREAVRVSIESARAAGEAALKTEWGESYEKKLEAAKGALNHEKLSDPAFKQFLEDTRFGDNPQVIKYFEKLSNLISEDTFNKPGKGDKGGPRIGEDGRPMLSFPSMEE
jgi:hypothetical protein